MKKILGLLFVAAMVSQAWAAPCLANGEVVLCKWSDKCWQLNSTGEGGVASTCATQASYCPALYLGSEASDGSCSGKTAFTNCETCYTEQGGVVYCDYGGPNEYGDGGCYEKTATECSANSGVAVTKEQCDARNAGQGGPNPGGGDGGGEMKTGPMCSWGDGGCWPIPDDNGNTADDCARDGWLFDGGQQGAKTFCEGGNFVRGKTNTPPTAATLGTLKGCCNWNGNGCFSVYLDEDWNNCAPEYRYASCPNDAAGTCTGSPQGGNPPSNNPNPPSGGPNPCEYDNSCGTQPIITLGQASANLLTAMQNAVNLQVKGSATLRIYDMKGKALSAQKIEQGNHVVKLQLPRGLYIIKATSGSWKQTVKVTVK